MRSGIIDRPLVRRACIPFVLVEQEWNKLFCWISFLALWSTLFGGPHNPADFVPYRLNAEWFGDEVHVGNVDVLAKLFLGIA